MEDRSALGLGLGHGLGGESSDEARSELLLLSRLALASFGPGGTLQGVQANSESDVGTLSSVSRRIFDSLKLRTWRARALVSLTVQPQHETFGDGGLLALFVAAKLMEAIERSCCSNPFDTFHVTQTLESILDHLRGKLKVGLRVDLEEDGRSIQPIAELRWNDLECVVALVRAVVASKLTKVSAAEADEADANENGGIDHICRTVAKAFVLSLPESIVPSSSSEKPQVGLIKVLGPGITQSFTTDNLIVDIPISSQVQQMLPLFDPSVVVVDTSLDVNTERNSQGEGGGPGNGSAGRVGLSVENGWMNGEKATMMFELDLLLDFVKVLEEEGVSILACQKTIHPLIKQELVHRKIVPIERVSRQHIGAVAQCSNAELVSAISTKTFKSLHSHVGRLKSVQVTKLKQRLVLQLEPQLERSMQTIVLTAPHEIIMEDLAHACRSAFVVLNCAITSPYVIPGGGCLEMLLSTMIEATLPKEMPPKKEGRLACEILKSLAGALRLLAEKLCEDDVYDGQGDQDSGPSGHSLREKDLSLDTCWKARGVGHRLLDLVVSKLAAIEFAIDAACNLSRVDEVLTC